MKKDFFISALIFHFLTKELRDKLSGTQYFEFTDLLRKRWSNKFRKIFLSGAVYDITHGFKDFMELTILRDDFNGCFDCYCSTFCK